MPVDLVVDHSIEVDVSGRADAVQRNMEFEFQRNGERYAFLKWSKQAFEGIRIVPPGNGIVHQVNLEYLARGVWERDGIYYPDTLVGTDSHTTMVNGIGVVGWGVGGIEAEAGMLGQPIYFLTPDVVGVHMSGKLREGVTATDVVLTVTELLRKNKVVGKFVEYFGEGAASLTATDRAVVANMSPDYGATIGFFGVDEKTIEYLPSTGRPAELVEAVDGVLQGAGHVRHPAQGRDRLQPGDRARSRERRAERLGTEAAAGPHRPAEDQGAASRRCSRNRSPKAATARARPRSTGASERSCPARTSATATC